MPKPPPVIMLRDLLAGFAPVDAIQDREISGLSLDSRQVKKGDLFFAFRGTRSHGGEYIDDALKAGAAAVALDGDHADAVATAAKRAADVGVPVLSVAGLAGVTGEIASRFFGHPSRALKVVGVTGTNGKTSCSQFLAQALSSAHYPCGVVGTIGEGFYGQLDPSSHTTPDAVRLQALLARLRDQGARYVVMEVSSHGLEQGRANGVAFDVALLTNLSRDHLDYHGDMAAYALAKRRLFERPGLKVAVLNLDDALGRELAGTLPDGVQAVGYSLAETDMDIPAVRGTRLTLHDRGLSLHVISPWGEGELTSGLLGRFNASNLLGVLAVLLTLDVPFDEALQRLSEVAAPPGRMERFGGATQPLAVVDYAHTPDALEQVLMTLKEHCDGALWCVFGCGGDRDRGKRPEMARAAEQFADCLVVTDDNPRSEDPQRIIDDILAGLRRPEVVHVERDRTAAINYAIGQARVGDIVLVAGKGHEDYQIVGDERRYFSDRETVVSALGVAA